MFLEFWNNLPSLWKTISIITTALSVILALYLRWLRIKKIRIELKEKQTEKEYKISDKASLPYKESNYDLFNSTTQEFYRLRYQANRIKSFELQHLDNIHNILNVSKPNVLDIGCADGSVALDRFHDSKKWGKIFGIDNQASLISQANSKNISNFSFYTFNINKLCKENFDLKKHFGEPIHLIFCTMSIHHMGKKNQLAILKYLWRQLENNGILYIRSFDDSLKLSCSEYSDLIDELILISASIPGASDRYHGRKLFNQLISLTNNAQNIIMDYFMTDTIHMTNEEKESYFQYAYGFRLDRVKTTYEEYPEIKELYERASKIIELLKPEFIYNDSFYALSGESIAYAIKKS